MEVVKKTGDKIKHGVNEYTIEGVKVKITSPAQTVVDCFKFRSKVGIDVAVEALKDVMKQRKSSADEIYEAAKRERQWEVMRPYLEML